MPFAEVVPSPHLHKFLLRGCSCRPHGKDTLCQKHAAARDKQLPPVPPSSQVARHRLRKALHTHGDVCHFEVQIAGFRGWQPACTINADVLAQHFASRADSNIRRRRERRVQARKQRWTGFRPRRPRTFVGPWHSVAPKQLCLGFNNAFFLLPFVWFAPQYHVPGKCLMFFCHAGARAKRTRNQRRRPTQLPEAPDICSQCPSLVCSLTCWKSLGPRACPKGTTLQRRWLTDCPGCRPLCMTMLVILRLCVTRSGRHLPWQPGSLTWILSLIISTAGDIAVSGAKRLACPACNATKIF